MSIYNTSVARKKLHYVPVYKVFFYFFVLFFLQGLRPPGDGTSPIVYFMGFEAHRSSDKIVLNWEVSYEKDAMGYYVERSTDGINWQPILFKAPTPGGVYKYSQTDSSPLWGTSYYRIRATGIDGRSEWSVIRIVVINGDKFIVKLYPVPAKDKLTLDLTNPSENTLTFKITDSFGRLRMTDKIQNLQRRRDLREIDISKLGRGAYILTISGQYLYYSAKFAVIE